MKTLTFIRKEKKIKTFQRLVGLSKEELIRIKGGDGEPDDENKPATPPPPPPITNG